MTYEISKPDFPVNKSNGDGIYPFLASVGVSVDLLGRCCIKRMRVTGIDSPQTISVQDENGDKYSDIPVWIHTDIGARDALIKGVERSDPADYFENAAFIFTFPGHEELSYTYVSVVTEITTSGVDGVSEQWKAVGVINVLNIVYGDAAVVRNISDLHTKAVIASTKPLPTYRPYLNLEFGVRYGHINEVVSPYTHVLYGLFDLLTGKLAYIPTYDGLVPQEPYHESKLIYKGATLEELYYYDNETGAFYDFTSWPSIDNENDSDWSNLAHFLHNAVEVSHIGLHVDAHPFGDFKPSYNDSDPDWPGWTIPSIDENTWADSHVSSGLTEPAPPEDHIYEITGRYGGHFKYQAHNWVWNEIDPRYGQYLSYTYTWDFPVCMFNPYAYLSPLGFVNAQSYSIFYTSINNDDINYNFISELSLKASIESGVTDSNEHFISRFVSTRDSDNYTIEKQGGVMMSGNDIYPIVVSVSPFFMGFYENFFINGFITGDMFFTTYNYAGGPFISNVDVAAIIREPTGSTKSYINDSMLNTTLSYVSDAFRERLTRPGFMSDDAFLIGGMRFTCIKSELVLIPFDFDIDRYEP